MNEKLLKYYESLKVEHFLKSNALSIHENYINLNFIEHKLENLNKSHGNANKIKSEVALQQLFRHIISK